MALPFAGVGAGAAGVFFVVPTLCAGVASPVWGALADRLGPKGLLIRAQVGLGVSFLCAGFAASPWQFLLALILQGLMGGTFAASRAYLGAQQERGALARSLTLLEAAPRLALVIAPACAGILLSLDNPIRAYCYLAALPLGAACMTWLTPEGASVVASAAPTPVAVHASAPWPPSVGSLLVLQVLFGVGSVLTLPYFTWAMGQRFPHLGRGELGLLFGVPNLTYLAGAYGMTRFCEQRDPHAVLQASFVIQALTLMGQMLTHTVVGVLLWRALMGVSMTASFVALHALIAKVSRARSAGRLFGWLEGSLKMSHVAGGILAGVGFQRFGADLMFMGGAAVFVGGVAYLTWLQQPLVKERVA